MKEKKEAIAYCLTYPDVYEDYPFHDPNWCVIRHRRTKKVFAWIFDKDGYVWINVKCDPEWRDFWRNAFTSVVPAYHLNKKYWNSIILDGTVPKKDIHRMIGESYDLTREKAGRKTGKAVDTIGYYNANAESFVEHTQQVDFTETQERFLAHLAPGSAILDFGCGSGRDTKAFLERGYQVEAIDGSEELCRIASAYAGIPVKQMLFGELDARERYDGVWACASILHLTRKELPGVLKRMADAVKCGGVIYASFKYGEFAGERNGRYFTDLTEESLRELLREVPGLVEEELWVTTDVRAGREDERWVNVLAGKRG